MSPVQFVRWARSLPKEIRRPVVQREIEVQLYHLWRKLTGRQFARPVTERVRREFGKCYLVTKAIPEFTICGPRRCYRFLVRVELEMVELDCPGRQGEARTFFCKQTCNHCGRPIKLMEGDRQL